MAESLTTRTWQWNLGEFVLPFGRRLRWARSYSPTTTLRPALDICLQMLGAEAGCFHLGNAAGGFKLVACTGGMGQCLRSSQDAQACVCLAQQAFQSSETVLTRELRDGSEPVCIVRVEDGMRSALCIRMDVGNHQVLGMLTVFNRSHNRFVAENLDLIQVIRAYVCAAVLAACLYGDGDKQNVGLSPAVPHPEDVWPALLSFSAAASAHTQIAQRMDRVYERFTNAVVRGADVEGMAETLAELLEKPVLIVDRFLTRIISTLADTELDPRIFDGLTTGPLGKTARHPCTAEEIRKAPTIRASRVTLQATAEHPRVRSLLVAPVVADNDLLAHVIVLENSRKLDETDFRALEHAAVVMALRMRGERAALETEEKAKGDFLRDLLMGRHPIDEELLLKARSMGYDLSAVERVLVGEIVDPRWARTDGAEPGELPFVLGTIADLARCISAGVAYASVLEAGGLPRVVLLYLLGRSKEGKPSLGPRDLAELFVAKSGIYLPETPLRVAIGSLCSSVEQLRQSFLDAERTLRVTRQSDGAGAVVSFDDLGVIRILLNSGRNPEEIVDCADRMIEPLLDYDRRHHSELVQSLDIWFRNNCSLVKASRAAFVHVSTLKYRLRKVEKLCNLDLDDADDRLSLQVALKIAHLDQIQGVARSSNSLRLEGSDDRICRLRQGTQLPSLSFLTL